MLARISLYRLLARLFRAAPDAELVVTLRTLPDLHTYLPAPDDETGWLEEAAVEHYALFGMTVFLYESLYRDHDLMVNTESAQQVATIYESCQFVFDDDLGAPDHLSHELEFVAALLETEHQAMQAGDSVAVQWAVRQREQFLQQHLAYWLPVVVLAIRRVESLPLYKVMVEITLDLVLSDLTAPDSALFHFAPIATLPEEEQSLGWLVRQLLTPDIVGLFLARADIVGIARAHELPISKGDRVTMLRSLLESAAQFEQLPYLLETIATLWKHEKAELAMVVERFPYYVRGGMQWQNRLKNGIDLLREISKMASAI